MKYTIDKQEKYTLVRLHEEKLDSTAAPQLKSSTVAKGVSFNWRGMKYLSTK